MFLWVGGITTRRAAFVLVSFKFGGRIMRVTFGQVGDTDERFVYLDGHLVGVSKAKHGIVAFRELNSRAWKRFVGVGELRRYIVRSFWSFA